MADILPIAPDDEGAVLSLNNANASELSWLTPEGLHRLVAAAFLAGRVGAADAFIIAFDQDADYDSPNFQWFRARHERFVYVDRVAVAASARGRGLARRLYGRLFDEAAAAGHGIVTCEVNSRPPNPGSDALHAALGFGVVGDSVLGPDKAVRYYLRSLG